MNQVRDVNAKWKGIVMIIRPDTSKLSHGEVPTCRVLSRKDPDLNYQRAICETLLYAPLAHYFESEDGDAVEVYVEFVGPAADGHLEFYEKASKRDFFLHPAQSSPPRALSA